MILSAPTPLPDGAPLRWRDLWLLAGLVTLFGLYFALPISDIDFWWHVASGRWIVEHRALPDQDPFGVYSGANAVRAATVLRGQWMGQVLAFLAFDGFGPAGTIALRVALLATATAAVFLRARAAGTEPAWSLAGGAVAGLTLLTLAGDRPQLFSFALVGVVFAAADTLERRWSGWLAVVLPAVVALWANLHGGAILGALLLAVHAGVGSGSRLRAGKRLEAGLLALLAVAALAATLATPNGITTYAYIAQTQGSELGRRTTEYVGTLSIGEVAGRGTQALAIVYFVAVLVAAPAIARRSLARLAVVGVSALASVASYRYHLFFVLVTAPWVVSALSGAVAGLPPWAGRLRILVAPVAVAVSLTALFAWRSPLPVRRGFLQEGRFPVAAMQRLHDLQPTGTALVWFNWSGYFLWTGFPSVRPFLDPRMLDDGLLRPYTHMIWATPEGMRYFDDARFEWILMPFHSTAGERYPLHDILQARPDFRTAFRWAGGALYQRVARE